ncbi:MAG: signal peptide peptidase SppA [Candidatus Saccharicenans sp.]|jgi:protease-4|nr:signal peptide peptidase SppA [Candidatus Saccharicenans sp.]MDH7492286.1 signal peptide peptidase SppA [Candidatus Saccharicenans sp.]
MKKRILWILLILFFFILIVALGLSYFFYKLGPKEAAVAGNSYLEIKLEGRLDDYTPSLPFFDFFPTRAVSLYDTWMNLRKAARDSRIKAVVIKFGLLDSDWAKIEELRQAVLEFRQSGKPVLAYFEELPEADKEYYLASACDRIILHPLGWLGVNGLAAYIPFFKGTLDRLGIKAEFEHIEEYKTAYNQFTETGFTPAHREMLQSIYEDIFNLYLKEIAAARQKSPEEMKQLLDRGYFQGQEAVSSGLIDELAYEDQLLQRSGLEKYRELKRISNEKYASVRPESFGLNLGKKVALIFASGTILTGTEEQIALGSETFSRWLRAAVRDPSIEAIIVRIDSPGGSAVGSDIIWHELVKARSEKPVVISMSGLAGSGGYWMALGGHKIIAQPQTLTGSIGVIAGKFSFEGLLEKLGVRTERLVIGKRADSFSFYRDFSPEERKILREEIGYIYEQFLERVSSARNLPREEVERLGRGRVWTGRQARELKLVDELGGLPRAVELACELAGLPAETEVRLVIWPVKRSLWDILLGRKTELSQSRQTVELLAGYRKMIDIFSRARVWSLMPFWIY